MKKGKISAMIVVGMLVVIYGESRAQIQVDIPRPIGRQLKRAAMLAELRAWHGSIVVPTDDAMFEQAPPEVRPDPDAVYEEIIQANPSDPPMHWLRKPEDERPLFPTLPYSEIELVRRLYRHARELWAMPGVWGFGIASDGFHIHVALTKGNPILPSTLEDIPVIVEHEEIPRLSDHVQVTSRPVGAGISVGRTRWQHPLGPGGLPVFRGAAGPFVVFDAPQVPACCNIYHTTAGHVMKHSWEPFPPNDSPGAWPQVRQPYSAANVTNLWYAMGWQLISVQSNPNYVNYVSVRPDLAIITHGNPPQKDGNWPSQGYVPSCSTADSNTAPARRVWYGAHLRVDGPNGAILPVGTNADVKIFGSEGAHASIAHINVTEYNMGITVQEDDVDGQTPPHQCGNPPSPCLYAMQPLHRIALQSGDLVLRREILGRWCGGKPPRLFWGC